MANLPPFPSFNIHDSGDTSNSSSNSAGVRWRKWTEKLDNLICALDIDIDKRKRLSFCITVAKSVSTYMTRSLMNKKG
ncbi:hypothetical protein DPMN_180914 [Dreissena polymorpha]|uniref:Uncharacterized protein n=1 Tax=Dreissena polymorpha TaxID=45954 RepID=A0A9D4DCP1_DREPO|nr:hypothetical protein DPMN_180914 [Dreissena polymorpha]